VNIRKELSIMSRTFKFIFATLALALSFSFTAMAQETTGSIEGTITDPAGAVVPGVEVVITSQAVGTTVGFRRTTTTDRNGFYRVQQIPPGSYIVSTTATAGFGSATTNEVRVELGRSTPVNITLAAGGGDFEVEVTADPLAIDPTDSKIQTSITARTAELLPKGTNFTSLLTCLRPFAMNRSAAASRSMVHQVRRTPSSSTVRKSQLPYRYAEHSITTSRSSSSRKFRSSPQDLKLNSAAPPAAWSTL
jgi:hypothetical protein